MVQSSITFLPVKDIIVTEKFYTEIVGLKLWKDMGNCKIFSCGEGYFGFCQYNDNREFPLGVCLSMNLESTEAVDNEYIRLKELGINIKSKPQKHPNVPVYSFFFEDINGYTLEFQKITD